MRKIIAILVVLLAIPVVIATNFEKEENDARDVRNADIDIIKAWSKIEGDKLALYIKVAGNINPEYTYGVEMDDGNPANAITITYSNGQAGYAGSTSFGIAEYEINGDTIKLLIPYGIVSSWNNFHFRAFATDKNEWDYTMGEWNNEGNGGDNTTKTDDPTKETPTDKSIEIKITKIVYDIKKVDNGQSWNVYLLIEGTTNGVDHVSLTYVIYYTDGTYEWADWIKGPINMPSYSGYGVGLRKFSFNSTEGNWNKWKFELDAKYPITQSKEYEWAERKDVKKVRVYARAYKDDEETKWNQDYYDTVPKMLSNGVSYTKTITTGSQTEGEGKKKTPSFEFIAFALAIAIVFVYKRKK